MIAYSLIREQPHYRRERFAAGLAASGFEVHHAVPRAGRPGDVLLIWNRYGVNDELAARFEGEGGAVLVAENGYLGHGGSAPKFDALGAPDDAHYYALSRGGHNGIGTWPSGDGSRWARLGIELRPWRADGRHVLVLPNRPFGQRGYEMPVHWAPEAASELRRHTRRPIVVREHPGRDRPARDLAEDLAEAWAAVVWSSSAGLHALIAGVPVICVARAWVGQRAAGDRLEAIEDPPRPARLPVFERLAWGQWTLREIERGVPFARLLEG